MPDFASDIILHHFDISPFAEKARKMMGLKGLGWHSVQIPLVMPKPELMPLTGGYRRTPVMQIGADIYCDSQLIARELERRFPAPSFFPGGAQGIGTGLAYALAYWSDRAFFSPGSGLALIENAPNLPKELLDDRKAFFSHMTFDGMAADIAHVRKEFLGHMTLLDEALGDGRPYLGGDRLGLADVQAFHVVWMARRHIPAGARLIARFPHVGPWEARVELIGHGQRHEMEARAALAIARAATPLPGRGVDADDPEGLSAGQPVTVTPEDYGKVPVAGRVVTADRHEVAILRKDPLVGEVVVHFPRIGFRTEAA